MLQQKVLPPVQRNRKRKQAWSLIMFTMLSLVLTSAQDISLSPTRPTVGNSAAIQSRDVLQVESAYDAYPQRVPGNQQTVDSLLTYIPLARLRMDFGWSAFNHQEEDGVQPTALARSK